jgi:CRISPR-associated endoribonuclease Cas6
MRRHCLYTQFFESLPTEGDEDARKFCRPPPPYILIPPLSDQRTYQPGDTISFELVLIGKATEALPYFIESFKAAGKSGLGKGRGTYGLDKVELVRPDGCVEVYRKTSPLPAVFVSENPTLSLFDDHLAQTITLQFVTPVRLKSRDHLVTAAKLSFPLFFEHLLRRLELLAKYYGSPLQENSDLSNRAMRIETTQNRLRWYDWERYSGRQKELMKFGGLIGLITFKGDLALLLPYIRLGEQVHVGQKTTFGLGKYVVMTTN